MNQARVFLKDYKSPDFDVSSVELDFNLKDDSCTLRSKIQFRCLKNGAPLRLDGKSFELISIRLDGRALTKEDYKVDEESLTLAHPPEQFTLEVETRLYPHLNTALEGLYRSNDCFVTQCEAQGFRTMTYFLDRPDVMTRYQVRLEADKKKYPVLLSNGDRISVRDLGNGRHEAHWKDPHKKPCYLFALVAGDLGVIRDHFTTASGRQVNLEVYAAHGQQTRCEHALQSLKAAMKWDEEAFGREYDLNDYMIVAIDDFNAGAMENKGLNIFNSRLVLADMETATDQDFHAIESVVGHEYFHNWTGNRVTLQNWFHLSLKEGLTVFRDQEFSADLGDRGVQRIQDVDVLRERQFTEDAGPTAHPVRPESCLAVDNFFTPTIYEKGSELIRMMQTTVGRKGFRQGMDLYFQRHDGQAVTTDDFAAAISDANKADFTQLKLWYSQAGTPQVHVQEKWSAEKKEFTLTLSQSTAPTPGQPIKKPFQIPVRLGLLDDQGKELNLKSSQLKVNTDGLPLVELTKEKQDFVFEGLSHRPHASLFREFSAPVIVDWNRDDQELFFLMAKDSDSFNRREAAQSAGLRVLNRLVDAHEKSQTLRPDEAYMAAWGEALVANLDPAFQSRLLALPSDSMLVQNRAALNALAFKAARHSLTSSLARLYRTELMGIYRRWVGVDEQKQDSASMGRRAMKNLALSLLAKTEDPEVLNLVYSQFQNAKNMTDRLSALMVLAESEDPRREEALSAFQARWKNEPLVLNKWLSVQASSDRDETFERVKNLTHSESFQITNPNNVYSLLRVYGYNLVCFHDPRHPGYTFMADKILEIDAKNPQVAARLCAVFNVVGQLPAPLKEEAKQALRRVLDEPSLSKNTRELLAPSLT